MPLDAEVLALERAGCVDQRSHAHGSDTLGEIGSPRIDRDAGVNRETQRRCLGSGTRAVATADQYADARIACQRRGNAAAEEAIAAENQDGMHGARGQRRPVDDVLSSVD